MPKKGSRLALDLPPQKKIKKLAGKKHMTSPQKMKGRSGMGGRKGKGY